MPTIVVVHGTGVRESGFDRMLTMIRHRVRTARPDVTVEGCYWGGRYGAELRAGGLSIPNYDSTRSPDSGPDPVALWGVRYEDPRLELRALASTAASGKPVLLAPNQVPAHQRLVADLRAACADEAVVTAARGAGLAETFPGAANAVLSDPATLAAAHAAPADAQFTLITARAIVAEAVVRLSPDGGAPVILDGAARDEFVRYLSTRLATAAGADTRSVGGRIVSIAGRLALRFGVAGAIARRRGAITDAVAPAAGDVLVYLARGDAVRAHIAATVRAVEPPVTLVAHSLGGVAAVDLCCLSPMEEVSQLVTVGCQASYLYEIGALPSRVYPQPLPDAFPEWLNIYDERDLLSYVAGPLFGARVTDLAIDSRQPFPQSHSAYFAHDDFYRAVLARV